MAKISAYERQRAENIEKNKLLLQSLGLDTLIEDAKAVPRPQIPVRKRKRTPEIQENADTEEPPAKVAVTQETVHTGVRRSARNEGKKLDYSKEHQPSKAIPRTLSGSRSENTGPMGGKKMKRLHDPKRYGPIPGIVVGTWWQSREECSLDSIHAPWVGGIAVGPEGAYSVALSGGYADDVDVGYAFTYTGSGGRDLKGTKNAPKNLRTAPQSCDQTFDNNFNKALELSAETGKPVRVIRGFKLKSKFAPSEGYRYDGLYHVEKAWLERGMEGFMVCKYAFKRLPGQPSLPERDEQDSEQQSSETAENTDAEPEESADATETENEEADSNIASEGEEDQTKVHEATTDEKEEEN